jgi:surfeit locus 1 family protein
MNNTTQIEILNVSAFIVRLLSLPSLARKNRPENKLMTMAIRTTMIMILNNTMATSLIKGVWYQIPATGMKTSLLKVIATTLALSAFIALGVWQLHRAQEKQAVRDKYLARAEMPAVDLDAMSVVTNEQLFRTATASGRYLPEFQIYLDNKVHRGRAGYHVLTPLKFGGADTLLLVNRGWAPWGLDRQRAPESGPPAGEVTVGGRLSIPVGAPISFEDSDNLEGLERVWQNFDADRYQRLVGTPVIGLVLELESDADPGLVREWYLHEDKWIQRHRGYAVQWFGMAVALIVILVVVSVRGKS